MPHSQTPLEVWDYWPLVDTVNYSIQNCLLLQLLLKPPGVIHCLIYFRGFFRACIFTWASFSLASRLKISSQILVSSLIAVSLSMRLWYSVSVILMYSPSWAASMESMSVPELLILSRFLSKSLFPNVAMLVKWKMEKKGNTHCFVLISQSQVGGALKCASSCNSSCPFSPFCEFYSHCNWLGKLLKKV